MSCPTYVIPMAPTGYDNEVPLNPGDQRGAYLDLECPFPSSEHLDLLKVWLDAKLPAKGASARIHDKRRSVRDRGLLARAVDELDGGPPKRKGDLGVVTYQWGGRRYGPKRGVIEVTYSHQVLHVEGVCNNWGLDQFRELVESFDAIGLGVDGRGFGLPGGWARLDFAAGISWKHQVNRTNLPVNFYPAYSNEVWLDKVFADRLWDADVEIANHGELLCVAGDRIEVRRALFCINGLLSQASALSSTPYAPDETATIGPWFEGPATGVRFPGKKMVDAFAARDDGTPRIERTETIRAVLSSARLRDGRIAADDPEFVADAERCTAFGLVSLRRCLASTWPVEVNPAGDFVQLESTLDGIELTVRLGGVLTDQQVVLAATFIEFVFFQEITRQFIHVVTAEVVS